MQNREKEERNNNSQNKSQQGGKFEKGSERAREAGRKGGKASH